MSDERRPVRPPQVTWGAAFAIVASALVVVSAFEAMAALHSVDTRDALAKALDSSMLRGRGLTVDQATDVLHGLLLVSGAGAAVVAVLAVFLVLGNVGARVVLTVLAVVVILGSAVPVAGPAIWISFVIAGLAALLSAVSYAEMAGLVPVAGSSYSYSYATMGEGMAWICGWCLVLEYAVSVAAVAVGALMLTVTVVRREAAEREAKLHAHVA